MDYDISVTIRRPPEVVFAALADTQRYANARGSPVLEMEKIPAGPTIVGTRWREVVRLTPHVTTTIWSEVADIEPGRLLAETFRGPWMQGTLRYTIEPTQTGCVVRQQQSIRLVGPLRLASGLMDRMFRPRVAARLESIRDGLEGDWADGAAWIRCLVVVPTSAVQHRAHVARRLGYLRHRTGARRWKGTATLVAHVSRGPEAIRSSRR